jgi:putative selenium metabolism hydrolase
MQGERTLTIDAISLTQKFIRTEGLSGAEDKMAELVEQTMQSLGFRDVERDEFGNVVGRVGPQSNRATLLFDGHMDVVKVVGQWTVDPFGGMIRDGRLYGRGATDMKGGLASAICGVAAAAATGRLKREVAVSASVLEEVIEGVALGAVLDRLKPEMVVICEPSNLTVKTGQRGRIEILLSVHGIPAHAAHPDRGLNPIDLAAKALTALAAMPMPSLDDFGRGLLVATDVITDPYPSVSVIPGKLTIRFDRRILPGETVESVVKQMDQALKPIHSTAFKIELSSDPIRTFTGREVTTPRFLSAWQLDPQHRLAQAAAEGLRLAGGGTPKFGVYGFCTNGSESAGRRGIPTIGLGPGREEDAHMIDESVGLDELRLAAEAYKNLTLKLAGSDLS